MIYVMSDIHGEYDKFKKMLKKIHFSDQDTLFLLGDLIDRGNQVCELLLDLSSRRNVYPLFGNHELMALSILKRLYMEINEDNLSILDETFLLEIDNWMLNGGKTTLDGFKKLDKDQALDLIDYLSDFAYYETIDVNDMTYIMGQAGMNHFDVNKTLDEYHIDDFCFDLIDYEKQYFDDPNIKIITGHCPTFVSTGIAEIYFHNQHIAIDCGACYQEGKLGCLCLDTCQVYYV